VTAFRKQPAPSPAAPKAVRAAGVAVAAEGATGLIAAAALVLRGLGGADQHVTGGPSLAVFFALVGGGVLAAGYALVRGKHWGRGVAIFANLLLLPVTWYLSVGSHRWAYGISTGGLALVVLGLLCTPGAVRWAAGARTR
jgi:hypothetical protein